MKKFDWDAFAKEENKIAVWRKTEKEAEDFCKQSHEHGLDWCTGQSRAGNTEWTSYEEDTAYSVNMFSNKDWYEDEDYTVLEWSDYMNTTRPKTTFTKSDLKDGDVILRRSGDVEIAIPSINVLVSKHGYNLLNRISEDLTHKRGNDWDIVQVRRPLEPCDCQFDAFKRQNGELVFPVPEEQMEEMTLEEVCEALGKKIKIVEKGD